MWATDLRALSNSKFPLETQDYYLTIETDWKGKGRGRFLRETGYVTHSETVFTIPVGHSHLLCAIKQLIYWNLNQFCKNSTARDTYHTLGESSVSSKQLKSSEHTSHENKGNPGEYQD